MKLELDLRYDETKAPFEARTEDDPSMCKGPINVIIHISDVDFDKKRYLGSLSTKESVETYIFRLLYSLGRTNLTETYMKDTLSYRKVSKYDLEEQGRKKLILEVDKIKDDNQFIRDLKNLEKRWYIEPRNEIVNDCDYWHGFFGTSNNFWKGSLYKRGNPAEKAKQLAYDLENKIRDNSWSIWFFPGGILIDNSFEEEQRIIIKDINKILQENSELKPENIEGVIKALRACVARYEVLEKL